jgi:uncharacterized coiled-coil protein SlyX
MTKLALEQRISELEGRVEQLEILLEEAQVLAWAERAAADAMEARMTGWIGEALWAQVARA